MLFILHLFLCQDRKSSLQRMLLRSKGVEDSSFLALKEEYQRLLDITERKKYQRRPLSWNDTLFAAKYYRSFQNEMAGKTVRYDLLDKSDQR